MWTLWRRWQTRRQLPQLLAGELDEPATEVVEARLAADPLLRAEYRRLAATQRALAALSDTVEPVPEWFDTALDVELAFADNPLRESFADLLERPDDPALARAREAVAADAALSADWQRTQRAVAALRALPPVHPPDGWRTALDRRLADMEPARPLPGARLLPRLAWAGTALLVGGCGWLAVRNGGGPAEPLVAPVPVRVADAPRTLDPPDPRPPAVPKVSRPKALKSAPAEPLAKSARKSTAERETARPETTERLVRVASNAQPLRRRSIRATGRSRTVSGGRPHGPQPVSNRAQPGHDGVAISLAAALRTNAMASEMPDPAALNQPTSAGSVSLSFAGGATSITGPEVGHFVDSAGGAGAPSRATP